MHLTKTMRDGVPSLPVTVGPSDAQIVLLRSLGRTPPEPVEAYGQIDTGAELCAIGKQLAAMLGLEPTHDATFTGPQMGDAQRLPCATGRITVTDRQGLQQHVEVLACIMERAIWRGDDILLGRNFLRAFRFVYDGPGDRFEISVGPSPPS